VIVVVGGGGGGGGIVWDQSLFFFNYFQWFPRECHTFCQNNTQPTGNFASDQNATTNTDQQMFPYTLAAKHKCVLLLIENSSRFTGLHACSGKQALDYTDLTNILRKNQGQVFFGRQSSILLKCK